MASNCNYTPEQQEQLALMSRTAYSVSGYPPCESTFIYTFDQMKGIIERHAKAWLDDLVEANLYPNPKNGSITAYVWLPKNSKHIVDNSLKNNNSAINLSIQRYSPQMKEFMDKFCAKGMKRLVGARERNDMVGVEILLENILYIELDVKGYEFGKQFGNQFKKNTEITINVDYGKSNDDGKYGKMRYIKVKKFFPSKLKNSSSLTPKTSANI